MVAERRFATARSGSISESDFKEHRRERAAAAAAP
jgi:hypothetical protein